jgi:hypothetical protein
MGSPSRDRIWRRNWISLAGVETPKRKLVGNCPDSATQLLLAKKFAVRFLGHIEVPPPGQERQAQEYHEDGCENGACHELS